MSVHRRFNALFGFFLAHGPRKPELGLLKAGWERSAERARTASLDTCYVTPKGTLDPLLGIALHFEVSLSATPIHCDGGS